MSRTVVYRFAGECKACTHAIRHEREIDVSKVNEHEYVRCTECNQINRIEKRMEV